MPPLHMPLQHWSGSLQGLPSVWHMPQVPQDCSASLTQIPSQKFWQQNGSNSQITAAHGLQLGLSASPSTHSSWLQVPTPQKPPSHTPEQHSKASKHGEPSNEHGA